ncbi:MAG: hypothetical protein JWO43_555 [Candidatus Adlerbacteria bacterium]|nr:hypothetical protein [Candidatus Adlerbacteria bacterium]
MNGSSNLAPLVNAINTVIVNPLLALLFAGGALAFVFGIVEFMYGQNEMGSSTKSADQYRADGKRHMFYGVAGMFIMAAAWSIIRVIATTICSGGVATCMK